jgi:hypothetical protein
MLPGLWQILVSMGLFAASRALPRGIVLAAGWYCLSGLGVLALASADHALSPWSMGLPFAVGQGLMGLVLHRSGGGDDA